MSAAKVFMLDNYDSFTWNLVQLLGRIGAEVTVARNDEITVQEVRALQPEAIVNATYSGIDGEGRPFSIRARSVRNPEGDPALLQLIMPDAQIALKDGSVLTIAADQGLYQRERESLELQGEVTLRRDGDLTVVTERANIDLRTSSASGDRPVGATSPHGTSAAHRATLTPGSARSARR